MVMAKRKELKVGDYVSAFGFDFTPLKWWERIQYTPKWWWNDISYWFRKKGQSIRDGFPSEESFDFYSHCSKWSLPRLKQLRDNLSGHPVYFCTEADDLNATQQLYFDFIKDVTVTPTAHEKWEAILDKIIWSMEHHGDDVDPIYPPGYDKRQIVVSVEERGTTFKAADERPIDWSPVFNHEKRVDEGFELFGKYFRNLWD